MDNHTLELLEFDKVRRLVASYASTSLGKQVSHALMPATEFGRVAALQAQTTEMVEALCAALTPPFAGLHDIRPLVRRARTGAVLAAEELAQIAETLRAIHQLDRWLARIGEQFPRLGGMRSDIGEFTGVANSIEGCLDSRGSVLNTASRRLSALRGDIARVEDRIQDILRSLLRSPEIRRILRYPGFTMVGHHYVLPVAKDHRGEIQGSVQRTSASHETVFIEPQAIAEQSAELSYLRSKEAKEVQRILRWLSAQVGQVADSLIGSLETLAELDGIHARGRYSLDYQMTAPDLNNEGRLAVRKARHPLLESMFRAEAKRPVPAAAEVAATPAEPVLPTSDPATESLETPRQLPTATPADQPRQVVPIDVHLGMRFSLLIVTGPNTGGKTVAIKTLGLLALMAQSGLQIPAAQGSVLPIFDAVLADIGDEQSLEQSLSTFSSHISRISQILRQATEHSLVLLDEMGAGTDPAEGAALGRAILDELDSIGCRAIVTTHLGELKTYAFANPRAENAAVEFDHQTLRPKFRLRIGDIGQSNALQIARRLELPEHLVDRAARYLDTTRESGLPEWELIQKARGEAEAARQSALEAQVEAQRHRDALERKLRDLQMQTELDTRIEEARARLQPGDRVVVERFGYDRPGRVVKIDPRKKIAVVSIGVMKWDVPIAEVIPQIIRPGEASPQAAVGPKGKPSNEGKMPRLEDFDEG